jgi:branched-chain amino acid transport system substrate-binding protein
VAIERRRSRHAIALVALAACALHTSGSDAIAASYTVAEHAIVTARHLRAIAAAALVVLPACSKPAPARIAVIGGYGTPLGAVLAAQDINKAGGINGRQLELGIVDEGLTVYPQQALATAESLNADSRVVAVIGHGESGTSLVASQVYNARHLVQIAPNTSTPLYTAAGPYSFRLVASDEHQAAFIAARVQAMSPAPRLAILYVNDDYGRALRGGFRAALQKSGTAPVYDAPFLAGEPFATGLDDLVGSIASANPDLLIWFGLPRELLLLRPKLRAALPHLRLFGSDATIGVQESSDLTSYNGDWLVSFTDLTADHPALRGVAARFLAQSGQPMSDGAALTYDAVGILAEALRSGASDREGIHKYLESAAASGHVFQGITGPISFDSNGDARPTYVMFEFTPGGLRRVRP